MEHERPFLFSGPLVLAILDGRKTVTRRLLAGSADIVDEPGDVWEQCLGSVDGVGRKTDRGRWLLTRRHGEPRVVFASRPTHIPGDGMWVRETWRTGSGFDGMRPGLIEEMARDAGYVRAFGPVKYEAGSIERCAELLGEDGFGPSWGRIRQSIFMPRWASRITRKVTRVVVERLQDITEEQARAEGMPGPTGALESIQEYPPGTIAIRQFRALWESINGKVPAKRWATNPLVVATTFEGVP